MQSLYASPPSASSSTSRTGVGANSSSISGTKNNAAARRIRIPSARPDVDIHYVHGQAEDDTRANVVRAQYFSMDVYCLGAMASVLKFFIFFVSIFSGALILLILTASSCWVEWLIIALTWLKIPHIRMAPFWLAIGQLALDLSYLLVWILIYWSDSAIGHGWWWAVTVVLGLHAILFLEVVIACANVSHSILAHHVILTQLRGISSRLEQLPQPPNDSTKQQQPPPPPPPPPSSPPTAPSVSTPPPIVTMATSHIQSAASNITARKTGSLTKNNNHREAVSRVEDATVLESLISGYDDNEPLRTTNF